MQWADDKFLCKPSVLLVDITNNDRIIARVQLIGEIKVPSHDFHVYGLGSMMMTTMVKGFPLIDIIIMVGIECRLRNQNVLTARERKRASFANSDRVYLLPRFSASIQTHFDLKHKRNSNELSYQSNLKTFPVQRISRANFNFFPSNSIFAFNSFLRFI